ncbi:Hypothetical_protein [Hexamita inflata]|uniref:Hypothetical_protein n=1 Tax=Hexamita inflata TaxID=28002 RepID=A0AA86URN7_9EUKA|nr:Hypothetical protein HINF_LOCUS31058 [Hexamita inflata]CAI9968995.1 Hypothetical protein HINF_LOCUS56640 [Hexamita inflata]
MGCTSTQSSKNELKEWLTQQTLIYTQFTYDIIGDLEKLLKCDDIQAMIAINQTMKQLRNYTYEFQLADFISTLYIVLKHDELEDWKKNEVLQIANYTLHQVFWNQLTLSQIDQKLILQMIQMIKTKNIDNCELQHYIQCIEASIQILFIDNKKKDFIMNQIKYINSNTARSLLSNNIHIDFQNDFDNKYWVLKTITIQYSTNFNQIAEIMNDGDWRVQYAGLEAIDIAIGNKQDQMNEAFVAIEKLLKQKHLSVRVLNRINSICVDNELNELYQEKLASIYDCIQRMVVEFSVSE